MILYSFRRCPYAMRARMAIKISGLNPQLREIELKNKPAHMIEKSPKGTVPVLILDNDKAIEESLDIMDYALVQNDPENWNDYPLEEGQKLIQHNDNDFKKLLDRYKYPDRYGEPTGEKFRDQAAATTLLDLEKRLSNHDFLLGTQPCKADIAIFPFIRQFALTDQEWFDDAPFPKLRNWLYHFLEAPLFTAIMKKATPWKEKDKPLFFQDFYKLM